MGRPSGMYGGDEPRGSRGVRRVAADARLQRRGHARAVGRRQLRCDHPRGPLGLLRVQRRAPGRSWVRAHGPDLPAGVRGRRVRRRGAAMRGVAPDGRLRPTGRTGAALGQGLLGDGPIRVVRLLRVRGGRDSGSQRLRPPSVPMRGRVPHRVRATAGSGGPVHWMEADGPLQERRAQGARQGPGLWRCGAAHLIRLLRVHGRRSGRPDGLQPPAIHMRGCMRAAASARPRSGVA